MDSPELVLSIEIQSDSDDVERIELARRLSTNLLRLDAVKGVEPVRIPLAERSKALSGSDWHTLLVTLAASGGVLTTLIGTLQAWLMRNEKASITLEESGDKLTITGATSDSQRRLVEDWIHRRKR